MIDLDHPCKQTCSGWKQGYERGRAEGMEEAAAIAANFGNNEEGIIERTIWARVKKMQAGEDSDAKTT